MDIAKRLRIEQSHLGERIAELKKTNQISQKQLAELSGLSMRLIRRIEKGEANPEFKTILRLAIGLKVAIANLFDYRDQFRRTSATIIPRNLEKQLATEREKLGIRILELCKHRKINQEELAVLSKIASSDISLYINGEENLVFLTLLKIAIGLEVEIIDLFNYDGTMPDNKIFREKYSSDVNNNTEFIHFLNMNLSDKLICLREYWDYSIEKVSKDLGLEIDVYTKLENGRSKINKAVAKKLSNLYSIPIEFFIADDPPNHTSSEIIYSNCSFDNGSSGYINHQYNDRGIDEILFMKKEELKSLNQQIDYLRKENLMLFKLVKTGTRKRS